MHAKDTIYSPDGAKDEQGNPVIRYEKDDLVATLVTDTEGKAVVNNLPLGSYYMKETIAGDHFVLNPEQKEFTLNRRGWIRRQLFMKGLLIKMSDRRFPFL